MPRGHAANYFFQRRAFRGLPIGHAPLAEAVSLGRHHVDVLGQGRDIGTRRFYEFGVGWDLAMALVLYSLGVNSHVVVDIRPSSGRSSSRTWPGDWPRAVSTPPAPRWWTS